MRQKINAFILNFDTNWDTFFDNNKYLKITINSFLTLLLVVLYSYIQINPSADLRLAFGFFFLTFCPLLFKDLKDVKSFTLESFFSIIEKMLVPFILWLLLKDKYSGFGDDFALALLFVFLGILVYFMFAILCSKLNFKPPYSKIHLVFPVFIFGMFTLIPLNPYLVAVFIVLFLLIESMIFYAESNRCFFTKAIDMKNKIFALISKWL